MRIIYNWGCSCGRKAGLNIIREVSPVTDSAVYDKFQCKNCGYYLFSEIMKECVYTDKDKEEYRHLVNFTKGHNHYAYTEKLRRFILRERY